MTHYMGGQTRRPPPGEHPEDAQKELGRREQRPTPRRDRALSVLATRQFGVLSREQLLTAGLTPRTIERWLDASRLHPLHRGVYAYGLKTVGQRGHWLAAVLACGDGAVLSHASAAALWGLVRSRGPVDVTSSRSHNRRGIRVHRATLHPEDRTRHRGIPVTSVARTLFDYAETVNEKGLRRAWEEADRLNLLKLVAVDRVCERGAGRRSLRPVRRLLIEAPAPARTRSPLEDRFLFFCHDHGLPQPVTNVLVLGREADAYWPAVRLVVELDGFVYHRHHAAFQRDRARDAALQAAGYHSVRVTHHRLDHEPATVLAELRRLLAT